MPMTEKTSLNSKQCYSFTVLFKITWGTFFHQRKVSFISQLFCKASNHTVGLLEFTFTQYNWHSLFSRSLRRSDNKSVQYFKCNTKYSTKKKCGSLHRFFSIYEKQSDCIHEKHIWSKKTIKYLVERDDWFRMNAYNSQTRSVAEEQLGKEPQKHSTYFFVLFNIRQHKLMTVYSRQYMQWALSFTQHNTVSIKQLTIHTKHSL